MQRKCLGSHRVVGTKEDTTDFGFNNPDLSMTHLLPQASNHTLPNSHFYHKGRVGQALKHCTQAGHVAVPITGNKPHHPGKDYS